MAKGLGKKIVIEFSEKITKIPEDSFEYFRIFWDGVEYIHGPSKKFVRTPISIERYSDNAICLNFGNGDSLNFQNACSGPITVEYGGGGIVSKTGPIDYFKTEFNPEDLKYVGDQNTIISLAYAMEPTFNYELIYWVPVQIDTQTQETFICSFEVLETNVKLWHQDTAEPI